MTLQEYECLQAKLSALIEPSKLFYKGYKWERTQKLYRDAILAAKSVLKNHFEEGGRSNARVDDSRERCIADRCLGADSFRREGRSQEEGGRDP